MITVEYLIWNDTKRRFLGVDELHFDADSMGEAATFTDARRAEEVRERLEEGSNDATYVMGWMQ